MKKKPVLRSVPDFPAWDQSFESLLESTPTHQVDYRINHTGDGKINLHRTVTNNEGQTVWTGVVLITSKDDAVDLTTQLVQALADL